MGADDWQRVAEEWFPTIVRYIGLGLVVYVAFDPTARFGLLATAGVMILYKSARRARKEADAENGA